MNKTLDRVKQTFANHKPELAGAAIAVAGMAVGYALARAYDPRLLLELPDDGIERLKNGMAAVYETDKGNFLVKLLPE